MKYITNFLVLAKIRIVFSVCFLAFVGFCLNVEFPLTNFRWDTLLIIIFILFLTGISAGLANNLLDYNIDHKMDRAKDRHVAINYLGNRLLWGISFILLFVAILLILLFFNVTILILSIFSFFAYVIWYTLFLKRNGPFGVILGGLPGSLPILIGALANKTTIDFSVWLFFALLMLWQPPHFWALSLKMKDEYKNANIPVLPNIYSFTVTKYFIYLYAFSLLPVSALLLFITNTSLLLQILGLLLNIYYLIVTVYVLEKKGNYYASFQASLVYIFGLTSILLWNYYSFYFFL